VLYTSPVRPRPSASAITPDAVAIPSTPVNGSFFVGVKTIGADNILLAYQDEVPLRAGTFFLSTDGTTWGDLNAQANISPRLAIDVTLGPGATCAPVTALTATPTGATTATVAFTAGSGNTSYTVTYTPAGGIALTVSPAPTASPVLLTGLTGGTAYTVSVVGNCGGGTATAATTTFTTGVPTATRSALGAGVLAAFPNPASRAFTLRLPAVAGARTATRPASAGPRRGPCSCWHPSLARRERPGPRPLHCARAGRQPTGQLAHHAAIGPPGPQPSSQKPRQVLGGAFLSTLYPITLAANRHFAQDGLN
jgi:hypothetical protein